MDIAATAAAGYSTVGTRACTTAAGGGGGIRGDAGSASGICTAFSGMCTAFRHFRVSLEASALISDVKRPREENLRDKEQAASDHTTSSRKLRQGFRTALVCIFRVSMQAQRGAIFLKTAYNLPTH
jgi:hypothetical protein